MPGILQICPFPSQFNQQSQYQMTKIPTEQSFLPPQLSESLPTFRQIGNYLNSISSASTIFMERDNTHTRLDSQLKLNSNKPSLDLQIPSNLPAKGESDILSYSQTNSLLHFEDSLMHLRKLLLLLSSKENMNNHIMQSLALGGFNLDFSKNVSKIVADSFSQYINMAAKVDSKLIKDQIVLTSMKINDFHKEVMTLKQQNLRLYQETVRLQNENTKYRRKLVSLKQKTKNPPTTFMIISKLKEQFSKIMNKMTIFQSEVFQKFIHFQDALINVTNLRNQFLKDRKNTQLCQHQIKQYQTQNKRLRNQAKPPTIERSVMKELTQNQTSKNQIENSKKTIKEKNEEIIKLSNLIRNISDQLNEQKNLYEQMLDKNIQLQKELYLKSSKPKQPSDMSQSFCIIDEDEVMKYIDQEGPPQCKKNQQLYENH